MKSCAKTSSPSPACSNDTDAGSRSCADQLRMEPGKDGEFMANTVSNMPLHACRNGNSAGGGSCAEDLCMELDKGEVPMTIEDMADTFINLLFAGHDTSAHTIARMLAELPCQPHVWEQLKKEQDAVSILNSHTHPC